MLVRKRLGLGDIERGTQATRREELEQRVLVDDAPARGVDEQSAVWQQLQQLRAEQAVGLGREREQHDEHLRRREQVRQLHCAVYTGSAPACHPNEIDFERRETLRHRFADRAIAEDHHGASGQILRFIGHPPVLALAVTQLRQILA